MTISNYVDLSIDITYLLLLVVGLITSIAYMMGVFKKQPFQKKVSCDLIKIYDDTTHTIQEPINSLDISQKREQVNTVAVLEFEGDIKAKGRKEFAKLVDEVLANKERLDSTIVVIGSPGGRVAEYGQLNAEMERIRKAGIMLVSCIDTYAASGGYLMSVPANKIVAAPYAIVGSIGVVAEFVNLHQMLKNLGAQPITITAGKFKRTLTPFGEVTEEGTNHLRESLESIHKLFIASVKKYRDVDVDRVCNGDHWTAQESVDKNLGLVDELATSHEYLFKVNLNHRLVFFKRKQSKFQKLMEHFASVLVDRLENKLFNPYT